MALFGNRKSKQKSVFAFKKGFPMADVLQEAQKGLSFSTRTPFDDVVADEDFGAFSVPRPREVGQALPAQSNKASIEATVEAPVIESVSSKAEPKVAPEKQKIAKAQADKVQAEKAKAEKKKADDKEKTRRLRERAEKQRTEKKKKEAVAKDKASKNIKKPATKPDVDLPVSTAPESISAKAVPDVRPALITVQTQTIGGRAVAKIVSDDEKARLKTGASQRTTSVSILDSFQSIPTLVPVESLPDAASLFFDVQMLDVVLLDEVDLHADGPEMNVRETIGADIGPEEVLTLTDLLQEDDDLEVDLKLDPPTYDDEPLVIDVPEDERGPKLVTNDMAVTDNVISFSQAQRQRSDMVFQLHGDDDADEMIVDFVPEATNGAFDEAFDFENAFGLDDDLAITAIGDEVSLVDESELSASLLDDIDVSNMDLEMALSPANPVEFDVNDSIVPFDETRLHASGAQLLRIVNKLQSNWLLLAQRPEALVLVADNGGELSVLKTFAGLAWSADNRLESQLTRLPRKTLCSIRIGAWQGIVCDDQRGIRLEAEVSVLEA